MRVRPSKVTPQRSVKPQRMRSPVKKVVSANTKRASGSRKRSSAYKPKY